MSGILNNLYVKGYQEDMIDWYQITVLLEVLTDMDNDLPKVLRTSVTSFYDFEKLYAWANQSNVRSIALRSVGDNIGAESTYLSFLLGKGKALSQFDIA